MIGGVVLCIVAKKAATYLHLWGSCDLSSSVLRQFEMNLEDREGEEEEVSKLFKIVAAVVLPRGLVHPRMFTSLPGLPG